MSMCNGGVRGTFCTCGRDHPACATKVSVGRGQSGKVLSDWLEGKRSILIAADINTESHARRLKDSILDSQPNIRMDLFIFPDYALVPDEAAVSALKQAARASGDNSYDAMLAVGSGTVNDLTRYISHQLRIPYYVAATAASMDGYASSVAPLIVNGLKLTFPAAAPAGVMGDANLMDTAPARMTAAGYGDIAGKWTSTYDWELEHIITGGDYCPVLAEEMRGIASGLKPEKGDAASVMRALLDSGLVMQRAGHSKPASGAEHHLSHFWEMMALMRGETPALHGEKVGVATLAMLRINEWLLNEPIAWEQARQAASDFDTNRWMTDMRRVYGRAAEEIISQCVHSQPEMISNITGEGRDKTIRALRTHWRDIAAAAKRGLPKYSDVKAGLVKMCAPVTPGEINVGQTDFINGVLYAHWVRPRFTAMKVAEVLGLLPEYANRLWGVLS